MSRFVVRPGTPSLDIRRRPATAQAVTSKRAIHIESPVPQVRPTPMFAKFSNASNPEFEERKAKLDTLYENVSSMLEMIHSIVEKNSHSPECVTFFNSFYKTMKSCLPKFMKESTKYFRAEADLKVNTTKTCVLSAKAMIPSAKIFASAWSNFKVQLSDSLTNYKPPQTSTILVLFESIKTDFHNILIANKNRKNASNSIKEIIESVELLCNTLMNNISNVFERNIGEDFSSNLCNTLQTDVRSFLSIVMKYFNSDFKISGISIPDLKRSKGSVQANGNAIIILIKNAFDFSKDVKEIQKRMSNYEPQLNEIFEVIEMS
ncbi:hypothetical protein TRFO_39297 [Tritrichomonas foetus]|uniref:Uncharacterized protein n=1 Tax=Tritrichomonas foetus TaxID=1144522 RepID=A0A1J4J8H7_9EUKA|nr:hypothetical protein TRFO_39297 [Tritrichomonas foetus]|eukprot:OHS94543.1 hypothetical protein TRFO_39297 [Tritrichomonas foetus]